MSFVIAIDGPAGSGKGTITKYVAKKIGFLKLDTGALYRCVTLEVIRKKINMENIEKIVDIAKNMDVKFIVYENDSDKIFLNGEDVTKTIRSNEVTQLVSTLAIIKELRNEMVGIQRKIGEKQNIIIEGRDIGTVVFPNADLKIYLDADINERAKRRYKENIEKGIETTYEEVLNILEKRDKIDLEREISPLKKAKDAVVVDSTSMSIEDVVNYIIKLYNQKNI